MLNQNILHVSLTPDPHHIISFYMNVSFLPLGYDDKTKRKMLMAPFATETIFILHVSLILFLLFFNIIGSQVTLFLLVVFGSNGSLLICSS